MFQEVPDTKEVHPVCLQFAVDVTGEALPGNVEELTSLSEQDLDTESEHGRADTNIAVKHPSGCSYLLSHCLLRFAAVSVQSRLRRLQEKS